MILLLATQIMHASGSSISLKLLENKKQILATKIVDADGVMQENSRKLGELNKAWEQENRRQFDASTTFAHNKLTAFKALSPAEQIQRAEMSKTAGMPRPQDIVEYWERIIRSGERMFFKNKNAKLSEIHVKRLALMQEDEKQRQEKKDMQEKLNSLQQVVKRLEKQREKDEQDKITAVKVQAMEVHKNIVAIGQQRAERKQHVENILTDINLKHILQQQQRKQKYDEEKQADLKRKQDVEKAALERANKEAQRKANQDRINKENQAKADKELELQKREQERIARQKVQSAAAKEKKDAAKAAEREKKAEEQRILNDAAKASKLNVLATHKKVAMDLAAIPSLIAERRRHIELLSRVEDNFDRADAIKKYDESKGLFQNDDRSRPQQVVCLVNNLIENLSQELHMDVLGDVYNQVVASNKALADNPKQETTQLHKYFGSVKGFKTMQASLASHIVSMQDRCKNYNEQEAIERNELLKKESIDIAQEGKQLAVHNIRRGDTNYHQKATAHNTKIVAFNAKRKLHNEKLIAAYNELNELNKYHYLVHIQNIIKSKPDIDAMGFLKSEDIEGFAVEAQAVIDANSDRNVNKADFKNLTSNMMGIARRAAMRRHEKSGTQFQDSVYTEVSAKIFAGYISSLDIIDKPYRQRVFEDYLNKHGQPSDAYSVHIFADMAKMECCLSDLKIKNKHEKATSAQQKLPQQKGSFNVMQIDLDDDQFAQKLTAQIMTMVGQNRKKSIDTIAEQISTRVAAKNSDAMPATFNIALQKTIKGICGKALNDELSRCTQSLPSPVVQNVLDPFEEIEFLLNNLFETSSGENVKQLVVKSLADVCQKVEDLHSSSEAMVLPKYFKDKKRLLQTIAANVDIMNDTCADYKSVDAYTNEYMDTMEAYHTAQKPLNTVVDKDQNHAINGQCRQLSLQLVDIAGKIENLGRLDLLKRLQSMIVINPHEKA